jgi:hypothetical protein
VWEEEAAVLLSHYNRKDGEEPVRVASFGIKIVKRDLPHMKHML